MSGRGSARTLIGAALWLAWLLIARPDLMGELWPASLVVLAALVVVPLGHGLVAPDTIFEAVSLPAGIALAVSYLLPPGPVASACALPWVATTAGVSIAAVLRLARQRPFTFDAAPLQAGPSFLAIGGAWILADRLGFYPLDFSPDIVRLTAVHFHYAGFALPLVAGLSLRRRPGPAARVAAAGVIAGVPAVAIGITASQLGATPLIETGAVALTAAASLVLAGVLAGLARDPRGPALARPFWGMSAGALASAMVLASIYGGRYVFEGPRSISP